MYSDRTRSLNVSAGHVLRLDDFVQTKAIQTTARGDYIGKKINEH